MELEKCILERRSIRNYQDKPLTKEQINTILESGRLAPSAHNDQPWKFYILRGEVKKQVVKMMEEKINTCEEYKNALKTKEAICEADTLVLVWNKESNQDKMSIQSTRFHEQSIGAAMENMCLTATSLGIGSLWIGLIYIIEEELKQYFHVTDMHLSCALTLGYATDLPNPRPRYSLDEITKWYEGGIL